MKKGYICDCCGREIKAERYDTHRAICLNEHYQFIADKGFENLKRFIDMSKIPIKSIINDAKLTRMEANRR